MPRPKPIEKPKQLVVEGEDARYFFEALLRELGISDVQVQNFGGVNELRDFLGALSLTPGFAEDVDVLAISRDAEKSPTSAFQSVSNTLEASGFAKPAEPLKLVGTKPKVAVMILPDPQTRGMLEDLCLRSVADDGRIECVNGYFDCIDKVNCLPRNMPKARAHAFLASCDKPGLRVGQAAKAGYWPLNNPAFDEVRSFLQAL